MGGPAGASTPGKSWSTHFTVLHNHVSFLHKHLNVIYFSDETRAHLHDHFEHEFDKRMVGSKTGFVRVPLDCLGPWHQLHWDGHEKIGGQALDMGGVSLPIYAGKDQFSTFVPVMQVIPNVCLGNTIGHLFLDMVEDYGCEFSL